MITSPSLDRMFMGLVVGALPGVIAFCLYANDWWFVLPGTVLAACLFQFLIFGPFWLGVRALGLRKWIGAAASGATALTTLGLLWFWLLQGLSDFVPNPNWLLLALPDLSRMFATGALMGWVTYGVVFWDPFTTKVE